MRLVVDNSVVMAWCFEDQSTAATDAVLALLAEGEAFVPSIWPLELASVLLSAERRRRLTVRASSCFLELVNSLPIRVVPDPPGRATREVLALAREHGLSSYDASYLDLAVRLDLPLATEDKDLATAAKKCRVPRVPA